jgi:hypothetical protein
MPELIDFELFLERGDEIPDRIALVEAAFAVFAPWMSGPESAMILDTRTWSESQLAWRDAAGVVRGRLDDDTLVFVYPRAAGAPGAGNLSVEDYGPRTVVGVAIPLNVLGRSGLPALEHRMMRFYGLGSEISASVLAVGSESETSAERRSCAEAIRDAASSQNALWIAGPSGLVAEVPAGYDVVLNDGTDFLVRASGLADWWGRA